MPAAERLIVEIERACAWSWISHFGFYFFLFSVVIALDKDHLLLPSLVVIAIAHVNLMKTEVNNTATARCDTAPVEVLHIPI